MHLPDGELRAYLHALVLAVELAEDGNLLGGYVCLDAGMEYAQDMAEEGPGWAVELARLYHAAASRYAEHYGAHLLW